MRQRVFVGVILCGRPCVFVCGPEGFVPLRALRPVGPARREYGWGTVGGDAVELAEAMLATASEVDWPDLHAAHDFAEWVLAHLPDAWTFSLAKVADWAQRWTPDGLVSPSPFGHGGRDDG